MGARLNQDRVCWSEYVEFNGVFPTTLSRADRLYPRHDDVAGNAACQHVTIQTFYHNGFLEWLLAGITA